MFCRTSLLCFVGTSLEQLMSMGRVVKWASSSSPSTCLPTDFKYNSTKYCYTFSDITITPLTNLWVVILNIFLKVLLPLLRPLYLWWCLVFPWNSIWITWHQILFWYSDHSGDFSVVVLSPAGRSWCMKSEYLALLYRWYCCCNKLFERENVDNVYLIISP